MAESAALWVDHRLPSTPWRQWVLTFEGPMATRLGYDAELLVLVCQRFATRVMHTLRQLVKRHHRLRSSHDLHPGVLDRIHRDLARLNLDDVVDIDPAIVACIALDHRSPRPLAVDDDASPRPLLVGAHAVVSMPDGSVRVMFEHPNKSGATFASMSRDTFLARLCALVPPPRVHLPRAYGVLASRHRLHRIVAPTPRGHCPPDKQLGLFVPEDTAELPATQGPRLAEQLHDPNPSSIAWAKLIARVFSVDVTICASCGGPMRVVKAVTDPDEIATALHGARAPPKPKPPLSGQLEMFRA